MQVAVLCYPEGISVALHVEVEQEEDGRWLAEVPELSGVLAYGSSRQEAIDRAEALALRVIADRLDHGEAVPDLDRVFSVVV
jgi:predicted RNase H-like HicB family nuclease